MSFEYPELAGKRLDPMALELVLNLKMAQAIGMTLPPEVLFRADRVLR